MPIINTVAGWPEAPARFESADGRIVAVVDAGRCGVRLKVSGMGGWKATLTRDGDVVYSGDPIITPAGVGVAYDAFPPIDADVVYRVVSDEGADVSVAVHTAPLRFEWAAVTPLANSAGSVILRTVANTPTLGRTARATLTASPASQHVAGSWDIPTDTGQEWTWLCGFPHEDRGIEERDRLMAALTSGPVFFRPEPSIGFPAMWAMPGDVSATKQDGKIWTVSSVLTPVVAPSTADLPAWIPGYTYADMLARGTFSDVANSCTYANLVGF